MTEPTMIEPTMIEPTIDPGSPRPWLNDTAGRREQEILDSLIDVPVGLIDDRIEELAVTNRTIHERLCVNLNPATNIMNPRAEALLSSGLGTRPSLGDPGDKYETGLEAIEEIEVIAAALARSVFGADFAEVRVPSGAIANLMAFMATCSPGDVIITPPGLIAGHVTHHDPGAAGLYGLTIYPAPIDADTYTVDVAALGELAREVEPKLITVGGSLNLTHHPVAAIRQVADDVGATVLFDAAHLCGMIAGGTWPNPLDEGAHLMTMSTYKSLAGPPGGLLVTNDEALAQRVAAISYPGLTANFDAAKTAALAVCLADWVACGAAYAEAMVGNAAALAVALDTEGVARFDPIGAPVISHQFALDASAFGGGTNVARQLRKANVLASAIGLPTGPDDGVRLGTPEVTRVGMGPIDMATVAEFVVRGLRAGDAVPPELPNEVANFRAAFSSVRFTADSP